MQNRNRKIKEFGFRPICTGGVEEKASLKK